VAEDIIVPSPHGALPAAKAPARLKKPILHRRLG
jgi:hypothetical protein